MTDRIPIARPWLPSRRSFERAVRSIWSSKMLSNFGPHCERFERRGARAVGVENALAVSSCDIGLILAWRSLGLASGEVVVPSFTFCSTVNALRWNGLTPVFADVDPRTLCVDPDDVRRKITSRTVGIAAVHTFGCPAPVDDLESLAKEHGVKLVFDAAHGLGARSNGRCLGAFGDASVFSLSGTKVVVAGEGGLAVFRDPACHQRFRELRGYGFSGDYNCQDIGLNGKLSEMNAALGNLSLKMLGPAVRRRREIASLYRRAMPSLRFQEPIAGDRHAYKDFAVIFPTPADRVRAEASLERAGVQTKRYFLPVHHMDAYRDYRSIRLPVTDDLAERVLCLPIFPDLTDRQVLQIAAVASGTPEHATNLAEVPLGLA